MRAWAVIFVLTSFGIVSCVSGCGTSMLRSKTRGWVLVETDDLRVRSDAGAERALDLATRYQRMYDAIAEHGARCAYGRTLEPLEVTHFSHGRRRSYFRTPSTNLLGLQSRAVVFEAGSRDALEIFVHELTHRFVALCFPTATAWLHEGLASFYETARLEGNQLEVGFPPYMFIEDGPEHIFPWEVEGERVLVLPLGSARSVDELRHMPRREFYTSEETASLLNYASAWALVHLLKHGPQELSTRFVRYLGALHEGESESTAWENSFADQRIQRRYASYIRGGSETRARMVQIEEPRDLVAAPMSPAQAALMLAQLEHWREDSGAKSARTLIDFAAEDPASQLDAMCLRAALQAVQGEIDGAKRLFEKVLVHDAHDADALAGLLQLSVPEGQIPNQLSAETRDWLRRLVANATRAHHFAVAASWTAFAFGDLAWGVALAERGVALDNASFVSQVALGATSAALGEVDRALEVFQQALALSWHGSDASRIALRRQIERLRELQQSSQGDD